MTLAQKVYESIQEDILLGRYRMNEFLVEAEIAGKYGVSKGTASEALHRLCLEGQLTSYPRKGYLLTIVTEEEFAMLSRLRIVLERLVIQILMSEKTEEERGALCGRLRQLDSEEQGANMRFHMKLAEATGDKFLVSTLYCTLSAQARSERYVAAIGRRSPSNCHERLLLALESGDAAKAEEWLLEDIRGSGAASVGTERGGAKREGAGGVEWDIRN